VVGPPGSGKTSTVAKLAAHLKLRLAKRVSILSMDMNRLAAHEQIKRYGEIIGVPVFDAQTVEAARRVAAAASAFDVVLVDTPGLGPRDTGRLPRLAALLGVLHLHEVHLTLPASLTPAVQASHAALFGPLGVSHLVLTRLDEAVGIGVILNAVERLGWAVSYLTDGQVVPNDIREACGRSIAELILAKLE
jgi:flagellar biosynthesis protein FlhF